MTTNTNAVACVCIVFMASEPLAGRRLSKVTERRTKLDWALFVQNISASYPDAERITLVMDNLNTNTPGSLYVALSQEMAKALWDCFESARTPPSTALSMDYSFKG